jgi:hypothetical protein
LFCIRPSLAGEFTRNLSYDSEASDVQEALEDLISIGSIEVVRSKLDGRGRTSWTVFFLEDFYETNRGDLPALAALSFLRDESGYVPTLSVSEERKGTVQEVQKITVTSGGDHIDLQSEFILEFNGEKSGAIKASPVVGSTCLGSYLAKQIITSSTEDTTMQGGDYTVSTDTLFSLTYGAHATAQIYANRDSCKNTALLIASELQTLPPLKRVQVSGQENGLGNDGCVWTVEFLSITGIPELLKGTTVTTIFHMY